MYLFSDWLWPANSNKSHGLQPCPGWVENFMKGRTVMGVLTLGDKHGHGGIGVGKQWRVFQVACVPWKYHPSSSGATYFDLEYVPDVVHLVHQH